MKLRFPILTAAIVLASLSANSPAMAMTASFKWCSGSPAFKIGKVPKGTAKLSFKMIDLQVPNYPHGGGEVAYAGQAAIPCGALKGSFEGPSPPPPQVHTYQWTIKALDKSGAVLATATTSQKFPVK